MEKVRSEGVRSQGKGVHHRDAEDAEFEEFLDQDLFSPVISAPPVKIAVF